MDNMMKKLHINRISVIEKLFTERVILAMGSYF